LYRDVVDNCGNRIAHFTLKEEMCILKEEVRLNENVEVQETKRHI
jgi:hypothetical protein